MTATSAAAAEHATTAISNASGNEIMAIDVGEKEIGIQDATGASLGTQPRKRKAPLSPPVTLSGLGRTQSQKRKAPLSPPVTVSDFDQQSVVIPFFSVGGLQRCPRCQPRGSNPGCRRGRRL